MKKIRIMTPENIEVEYNLASLGSRTAAALVDTLIQGIILLLIGIAVFLIAWYSTNFWDEYYGWIIGISLIIFALINYGYYIAMELTMNGQTLGKKLLKLRVIRNNGQSLALKHSLIRNLFRVFVDVFGVGIVLMFFSKQHKRVGDYVASTIVVAEESKEAPITLDTLMKSSNSFEYYLSKEEQDILRDFYNRKDKMENYNELQEELKNHFTKKFEKLGTLGDYQNFINQL